MRLSTGAGTILFGSVITLTSYGCESTTEAPRAEGASTTVSSGLQGCSVDEVDCAGSCVDLHIDQNNCGACGTVCTGGKTCSGGVCGCTPDKSSCSGACVDLHIDPNNCGACGSVCASGATCSGGVCSAPPVPPTPDAVIMDPSIGSLVVSFSSASNPALTTLPVVYTPIPCGTGMCTTRDMGTKTAPLKLPCDVDFLAVGVAFKNVSAQPLYIEWGGALWNMGDEKKPIANAFGQTEIPVANGLLWAPGQVGTGGFIFIAQPPLLNFGANQFPANVPLRIQMSSKGFTSPTIDPARGSYALANAVPEDVVWNNNFRIWVRRSCP